MTNERDLWLTTGHRVRLCQHELRRLATHRSSIALWSMLLITLVALGPYPRVMGTPTWMRVAVYLPSIFVAVSLFVLVIWLQFRIAEFLKKDWRAYSSPAILVAAIGGAVSGQLILSYLQVPVPGNRGLIPAVILMNYILGEAAISIYCTSLLPAALDEVRSGKAKNLIIASPSVAGGVICQRDAKDAGSIEDDTFELANRKEPAISQTGGIIRLGATRIKPSDIIRMTSHGGYTEIFMNETKHVESFPLQELAVLIPDKFGYQIHRSHWISFGSISSIKKNGRNSVVSVRDGTAIPVARHRRAGFEKAFEIYLDAELET